MADYSCWRLSTPSSYDAKAAIIKLGASPTVATLEPKRVSSYALVANYADSRRHSFRANGVPVYAKTIEAMSSKNGGLLTDATG